MGAERVREAGGNIWTQFGREVLGPVKHARASAAAADAVESPVEPPAWLEDGPRGAAACSPPAAARPPATMGNRELLAEYLGTKARLDGMPSYPDRARDEGRLGELRTTMERRAAKANDVKHSAPSRPEHDDWQARVPAPGIFELRTRSYAPFARFGSPIDGGSFAGDGRGASARLDVTSRVTQATLIDTRAGISLVGDRAYSDPSHFYVGDATLLTATASPRSDADLDADGPVAVVSQRLAAGNPLVPGAPDIDVDTEVHVRRQDGRLVVHGRMSGDGFPSAEALLTDGRGQTLLIHTFQTPFGKVEGPMMELAGDRAEAMGHFEIDVVLDAEGDFAGVRDPRDGHVMSVAAWNTRMVALQ